MLSSYANLSRSIHWVFFQTNSCFTRGYSHLNHPEWAADRSEPLRFGHRHLSWSLARWITRSHDLTNPSPQGRGNGGMLVQQNILLFHRKGTSSQTVVIHLYSGGHFTRFWWYFCDVSSNMRERGSPTVSRFLKEQNGAQRWSVSSNQSFRALQVGRITQC